MRKFLMATVGILAIAAGSELAQAGPIKIPGAPAPDLIITKLELRGTTVILRIAVDVTDNCHRGRAYSPFVQAQIFTAKGGQPLWIVGNTASIPANGIGHVELDVAAKHLPMTSYVYAEVNPNHTIPEVATDNNYQSVNPASAPFPEPGSVCANKSPNPIPQ